MVRAAADSAVVEAAVAAAERRFGPNQSIADACVSFGMASSTCKHLIRLIVKLRTQTPLLTWRRYHERLEAISADAARASARQQERHDQALRALTESKQAADTQVVCMCACFTQN